MFGDLDLLKDAIGGQSRSRLSNAARAGGASEAELQQVAADSEGFLRMYANPLFRIPISFVEMFPIGVAFSLISAALLRNSRFLPARGYSSLP